MNREIDWKQEAQKHAAEAGEMKIAIAQKLEEVRADIVNIRHMLITEDTALDQAILSWKKEQLEFQQRYIYGGCYRHETWTEYCRRKGILNG